MVDVLCVFQILSAKQGIILWLPHLTLIHWKREITCAERSRSKGSKQIDHPSSILNFQYEPTYKYFLYPKSLYIFLTLIFIQVREGSVDWEPVLYCSPKTSCEDKHDQMTKTQLEVDTMMSCSFVGQ